MERPICLIIPPSGFLLDERVFMSLGVLKVAAALERSGRRVEVLDLSGVTEYVAAVAAHARSSEADCFGITATSPQLPAAVLVARVLRKERPESRLILGGPHVTLVSAALKKGGERAKRDMAEIEELFDVLVAGDGEAAIFEALSPQAAKLIDADNRKSPLFLGKEELDVLVPARHLVAIDSYHYAIEGEKAVSLIGQLGCPFGCRFCGGRSSPSFRAVRLRSAEKVVEEMTALYEDGGFTGFMFYDDELNVNPGIVPLMEMIAEKQRELGAQWKLRGFVKAELFDGEQARAMYAAGFRWILTGFESGSSRILSNIDKKASLAENARCIETARAHGLKIKALMSIGHPGESEETVRETEDWLLLMKPDDFDLSIITTYPGTPYYDEAVLEGREWVYRCPENGDRLYQENLSFAEVANFYKGRPGNYRAYVRTESLSASKLASERDRIEHVVRLKLGIPFPSSATALRFEHSMGQSGALPPLILRRSM
jgi:radical SAM superfamily enzyme YgiQ (UPF0313 family)